MGSQAQHQYRPHDACEWQAVASSHAVRAAAWVSDLALSFSASACVMGIIGLLHAVSAPVFAGAARVSRGTGLWTE